MYKNDRGYIVYVILLAIPFIFFAKCTVTFYFAYEFTSRTGLVIAGIFLATPEIIGRILDKIFNYYKCKKFAKLVEKETKIKYESYYLYHESKFCFVYKNHENDYSVLKIVDDNKELLFICYFVDKVEKEELVVSTKFLEEYIIYLSSDFKKKLCINENQNESLIYTFEGGSVYAY